MRRFLVSVVLAAAGVLVTPAAAWAHAELVSSNPGYGDRLPAAPTEVRLDFSGPVDLTGARLTLQRKGGSLTALGPPTHAAADQRMVSIPLPARLADGGYTAVWFFLGNDGHLMGGEVPFHVGAPAAGTPAPPPLTDAPAPRTAAAVQSLGPGIAGPPAAIESVKDSTRMRPLLTSVGVELGLAVVILASTAVLVGRVPPSERIPTNSVSTLKGR